MHSHVEHLNEPAASAVIRVFPKMLTEMIEDDDGNMEAGERTALMSVNVTTDVLGREGETTQLAAFTIPIKILRELKEEPEELTDLAALATSLTTLVTRLRSEMHLMAATQQ